MDKHFLENIKKKLMFFLHIRNVCELRELAENKRFLKLKVTGSFFKWGGKARVRSEKVLI